MDNIWLGKNKLIIAFGDDTYHVLDSKAELETVFTGNYEECIDYCEKREILHKELATNQL